MIAVNHLMIKEATAPVTPTEYFYNAKCDAIAVEVSGDFSSASVIVEGRLDANSENWTPLALSHVSDYTGTENGEITKAGIYELGGEAVQYFRARLASVSGGAVTVFCRMLTTGV